MCSRKPSVTQPSKNVGFATEPKVVSSASTFNEELGEIVSLCTELGNCHQKVRSVGFLNCSKGYRYELYTSVHDSTSSSKRGLSLSELLSRDFSHTSDETPYRKESRISREDRKRLSLNICVSLLQFYQTPWITGEWSGDEIIFKSLDERTQSLSLRQPYLRRRFIPTAATPKDTQAIIFRLGVLLLELCLGERLVDHYQGAQCKEPEWKMAYERWEQNAKAEEGPEVAEAIRKCLDFDFRTQSRTLGNEELRKALYNEVVRPLKAALENLRMD